MAGPERKPNFLSAWLADLKSDVDSRGGWAIVPWLLGSFIGIGAVIGWTVPASFWNTRELPTAFFAAVLTLNGLLLALSWSSFSKIYEATMAPGFSAWLRRKGMLNTYHFFIDFIHLTQVAALGFSGIALLITLYDSLPLVSHRIALAASIASSLYALRYAVGSVRLMQDLIWYKAQFDDSNGGDSGNVVPMSRNH